MYYLVKSLVMMRKYIELKRRCELFLNSSAGRFRKYGGKKYVHEGQESKRKNERKIERTNYGQFEGGTNMISIMQIKKKEGFNNH